MDVPLTRKQLPAPLVCAHFATTGAKNRIATVWNNYDCVTVPTQEKMRTQLRGPTRKHSPDMGKHG